MFDKVKLSAMQKCITILYPNCDIDLVKKGKYYYNHIDYNNQTVDIYVSALFVIS